MSPGLPLLLLIACGGDPVTLSGAVNKGPYVLGSTVSVSPVDGDGEPSGEVFLTQTRNDLGEFEVEVPGRGFVALEGNGFYFNEVTGDLSAAPITLRAFYEVTSDGSQQAYVNPFTHLSSLRVKELATDGQSIAGAIAQAEGELVAELAVGAADFALGAPGTDLNLLGGETADNAYLFAVSAILLATARLERPDAPDAALQELMNTIAEDLRPDGELSDALRDRLDTGEATLDVGAVMDHLGARLTELGGGAEVPDLAAMTDVDHDGFVTSADCDDGDAAIRPDAQEVCDADQADEDCDGLADDADDSVDVTGTGITVYQDLDGDGFGSDAATQMGCRPSSGWSAAATDCDDEAPDVHPEAAEAWDSFDGNCDGSDLDALQAFSDDWAVERPHRPASVRTPNGIETVVATEDSYAWLRWGTAGEAPTVSHFSSLSPAPHFSVDADGFGTASFFAFGLDSIFGYANCGWNGDPDACNVNDYTLDMGIHQALFDAVDVVALAADRAWGLACGDDGVIYTEVKPGLTGGTFTDALGGTACFIPADAVGTAFVLCDDSSCTTYGATFAAAEDQPWTAYSFAEVVTYDAVLAGRHPDLGLTLHDFDTGNGWTLYEEHEILSAAARKHADELFLFVLREDPDTGARDLLVARGDPDGTWEETLLPFAGDLPTQRPEHVDLLVDDRGLLLVVSAWDTADGELTDAVAWSWNPWPPSP